MQNDSVILETIDEIIDPDMATPTSVGIVSEFLSEIVATAGDDLVSESCPQCEECLWDGFLQENLAGGIVSVVQDISTLSTALILQTKGNGISITNEYVFP